VLLCESIVTEHLVSRVMPEIHSPTPSSIHKKLLVFPRAPIKYLVSVATLSTTFGLGVAIAPGFSTSRSTQSSPPFLNSESNKSWEIAQTFRPPNRGAPASTEGAGTRGGYCLSANAKDKFKPLIPSSNLGLTISEHPTFFGYIPKSTGKIGEFVLRDQNNRVIYRTTFPLPSQPGIVSVTLPTTQKPLQPNKMYQWSFVLVCDLDDRSNNAISPAAWIERIEPHQTLADQLKNAAPETLPTLYAEAGIWHDALASRVKLRPFQSNADWETNWEQLLQSAGLQAFVQEPLVECCQVSSR
jgi:Domain of Unknown Function (DUF928)